MEKFRLPTEKEKLVLDILSSHDFLGNKEIHNQLLNCKVRTIDKEGSLEIQINKEKSKSNVKERVPVEAELRDSNYPVCFLLHVVDGYAVELDVYRADSSGEDHINKIQDFSKFVVFS